MGWRYKEFKHRYYAYIRIGEDEMRLGSFKDINDAAIARLKAEIFYRGGVQIKTISKKKDTSREKVNCDHAGIVEKAEEGRVWTIEGNSSDSCREKNYPVGYYEILGYGAPAY